MNLIEQEVSQERWIKIPEEILEILLPLASGALGAGRVLSRKISKDSRPYLLQRRKCKSRGQSQAEYSRSAGLVQQAIRG